MPECLVMPQMSGNAQVSGNTKLSSGIHKE
jgi:hypothetical protein